MNNRVPYYNDQLSTCDDSSDLVSEPDFEFAEPVAECVDSDSLLSMPAYKITKKSSIELTDHQQTLLDHAVSRQLLRTIYDHDIFIYILIRIVPYAVKSNNVATIVDLHLSGDRIGLLKPIIKLI